MEAGIAYEMRSASRTACGLPLLLGSVLACASPPPGQTWVELRVTQCEETVFAAPVDRPGQYVAGTKYQTAYVTGEVLKSWLTYDASQAWIREWAQRAQNRLPASGSSLSVVLAKWNAAFCKSAVGEVRRFMFDQSCDVYPLTGRCLPPHQLVLPELTPPQISH